MADGPVTPAELLDAKKASPVQVLVRLALTLVLLYLIFGVLIPGFASYSDIWASIKRLDAAGFAVLVCLTGLVETLKSLSPVVLVDGLGLRRSFLAQETSAMVSYTVPGPSGTAMRYVTYRRYGLGTDDFGRSTVVTSLWDTATVLLMPCLAIGLLSAQADVPGRVVWLTLIALAATVTGIVVVALILRSERFARGFGERLGRFVNWARGVVRRPKPQDYADMVAGFRGDLRDSLRRHWRGMTAVILAKELVVYLVLLVSLRSVGAGRGLLTAVEVFAVYAVVKVATMVQITPGGVGITETLYISALLWASGGAGEDAIVGGVFVFRMFTYLGPILLGLVCWPVLGRVVRGRPARPGVIRRG
ncbi:lysylphosphatidylglycerol synthase transmembrane domain-containing protein [Actinomadura fibrosa]|uniref:YbhN family protein n=1 Tax=Actinomadura fibrosa TaxID=111802 RepID=A0ABW2XUB0_9ACTN|nr:YbhN family protein [Actinomadura fibrosa]